VPFVPPLAAAKRATPRSSLIQALEGWTAPARATPQEPRLRIAPEPPVQTDPQARVPTERLREVERVLETERLETEAVVVPDEINTRTDETILAAEIEVQADDRIARPEVMARADQVSTPEIEAQADQVEAQNMEMMDSSSAPENADFAPPVSPKAIQERAAPESPPMLEQASEAFEGVPSVALETVSDGPMPELSREATQPLEPSRADETTLRRNPSRELAASTTLPTPEASTSTSTPSVTPEQPRNAALAASHLEAAQATETRVLAPSERVEPRANDRARTPLEPIKTDASKPEMVTPASSEPPRNDSVVLENTLLDTPKLNSVNQNSPVVEPSPSKPEDSSQPDATVAPPVQLETRAEVLNEPTSGLEMSPEIPSPEHRIALEAISPEMVSRTVNEAGADEISASSLEIADGFAQALELANQPEAQPPNPNLPEPVSRSSEAVAEQPAQPQGDQLETVRTNLLEGLEKANQVVLDVPPAPETVVDVAQVNAETPSSTQEIQVQENTVLDGVHEDSSILPALQSDSREAESQPRQLEAEAIGETTNGLERVQDALTALPDVVAPEPTRLRPTEQPAEPVPNENVSSSTENPMPSGLRPDARVVETFMPRRPRPVAPARPESSSAPRPDAPTDRANDAEISRADAMSVRADAAAEDDNAIDRLFQTWRRPEDRFSPSSSAPVQNAPASSAPDLNARVPQNTVQNAANDTPSDRPQTEVSSTTAGGDQPNDAPDAAPDALLETLFRVWTRNEDRYAAPETQRDNAPRVNTPNPASSPNASAESQIRTNPQPQTPEQVRAATPRDAAAREMMPRDTASRAMPRTPASRALRGETPLEQRDIVEPGALGTSDALPSMASNPAFVAALETREDLREAVTDNLEPTPLPESTWRFLRPIVGIDPNEARVHRGPLADTIAGSKDADAVTIGRDVFVADGHADGEPETLGLLAHELTHVARALEPRFVPPVVRGANPFQARASNPEERVALDVESRVIGEARSRLESGSSLEVGAGEIPSPPSSFFDTNTVQDGITNSRAGRSPDPWNGLPAPWEPMPAVSDTRASSIGGTTTPAPNFAAPSYTSASVFSSPGAEAGGAVAQTAERGRDLEASQSTPDAGGSPDAKGGGKQDMDALARQVYAILKRKLDAERRRGF
jgi:hypothetical protein